MMASSGKAQSGVQRRVRTISDNLRLLPVVELEPGAYGSAPQPGTSPWTAEESDTYWRACLRAGGVVGVAPVVQGSWLVALDALNSPDLLHRVLQVHFAGGVPADLDGIDPFCGGLALVDDSELLILPTCCGDLGALDNWQIATEQRTELPEMLWIGHPCLTVWYHAPMLHIREEAECNLPTHPREFAMNPEALQSAVRQATRELDLFCERVVVSLRELTGVLDALDARAIGRILVGKRDS
ncbi:hypothetical protein [Sorangium sp. So ce362]|uniref:hypothetical protein n=1 Tax=Sorangium sp. So ce362 TaxID=3133303 RepID=UPI003F5F2CB9